MAEPRGLFNRSSSGLGTILGPKGKDFFDYQLAGQEQKRREAAAKKAAADKKQADLDKAALKLLESKDTYAIYQDAADNGYLLPAIESYANGTATQADLMKAAAGYANLINKGNQLQKVDETAFEAAKENKRINQAEWTKMRNETLLADGSLQALESRTVDPETGMVFYRDQVGGSAALNEQAVVTDVVAKLGEDITSYMQGGDVEWLRGNRITKNQQNSEKVNKAFQYDSATGSYRVKSADDLMDLGITDAFMKDGDMKRIVMDKIFNTMTEDEWDALSTDQRNRRISETVAETLKPYAGGEMKVEDKTRSDRYTVKTDTGDDDDDGSRQWYLDVKSGDKTLIENSLNYLTQDGVRYNGTTLRKFLQSDPQQRTQLGNIYPRVEYTFTSVDAIPDQGIAIAKIEPTAKSIEDFELTENKDTKGGFEQIIVLPLDQATNDPELWNTLYNPAKQRAKKDYDRNKPAGTLGGGFNNNDPRCV